MASKSQLRIAVFVDHLESDYPAQIVTGVLRAARSARARTLIVPGGWLSAPEQPVVRNFVYDLLQNVALDGLVVAAGSLSNFSGIQRFREWLARFALPTICVGLDVGSVASVYVDNESGMYAATSHLIEQHGRRRLAFIGGPPDSSEARARHAAYQRALKDHELPIDERLFRSGGLGRESGVAAVSELLDQRRMANAFDALGCVNDDVALGALEELNRRGIAVPDAISVVGFDDSTGARMANPPLTTVNQQVELQAHSAARMLIEAIERGAQVQSAELKSEAVFRASCGCRVRFQNDSAALLPPKVSLARSCRMALIERRDAITAELSRAGAGRVAGLSGWESRLLDALMQDLATPDAISFVRELENLARRHVGLGRDILICHEVLSALRLQVLACATLEPASRPRIEDVFQESRLSLSRIGADVERDRQHALGLRFRILSKACLSLLGEGKLSELSRLLDENLPLLGIESFAFTRFRARDSEHPLAELEVLARRSLNVWQAQSQLGAATNLGLDAALEQEQTLVVEPLDFNGEPVGLAVFSWGATEPVHYEQLREMLSAAAFAASLPRRSLSTDTKG